MESKDVARKTIALFTLVAVAAAVFIIAPDELRLIIALVALPLETFMIASLLGGAERHVPQP